MRTRIVIALLALFAVPCDILAQSVSGSGATEAHVVRYARLGYGPMVSDGMAGAPAVGFGVRAELDTFAIDISFLNLQTGFDAFGNGGAPATASFLKVEVLRFARASGNGAAYAGGGVSFGSTSAPSSRGQGLSDWFGMGLQGEFTGGYEFVRWTPLRVFVQGDVTLPFYRLGRETSWNTPFSDAPDRGRYVAASAVSIGVGW